MPTKKKRKKNHIFKPKPRVDWVHQDVDALSNTNLKMGIRTLASSVRKSIKQLTLHESEGITSPAITFLSNNLGGRISTVGTREELERTMYILQDFMKHPQHTVSGYNEFLTNVTTTINEAFPSFSELSREDQIVRENMFWRAFNRIMQTYPHLAAEPHKATDIIDATKEVILNDMSINSIDEAYDRIYEYIKDDVENLPSAVARSHSKIIDSPRVTYYDSEGNAYKTRGDRRTKAFRSEKYHHKTTEDIDLEDFD